MRILAIDFGLRKIGLAFSEGELVEPLMTIRITNNIQGVFKKIKTVCFNKKVERIVIGLPEGKIRKRLERFTEDLKKVTKLPVTYHEETLTSHEAIVKMIESGRGRKFRHQMEDAIAASLILQTYLEKNNV